MNNNRILKMSFLVPMLLLSSIAGLAVVPRAYATASLALDPATINDETLVSGSMFQYNVVVSGLATSLFAYQFDVTYTTSVLTATGVSSLGPFFDALVAGGLALPVITVDDSAGIVSVAVTSLSPSFTGSSGVLATIDMTVDMAPGTRSDQALSNNILLHNAGGGVLENIVHTTSGAIFATGLFARADLPLTTRKAWPEKNRYRFSQDTAFTIGLVTLFGNINNTGTLSARAFVRFTISSDYGVVVLDSQTVELMPLQDTAVPVIANFDPENAGIVNLGVYRVRAQVFFNQVNIDGTVDPTLRAGELVKPIRFEVLP